MELENVNYLDIHRQMVLEECFVRSIRALRLRPAWWHDCLGVDFLPETNIGDTLKEMDEHERGLVVCELERCIVSGEHETSGCTDLPAVPSRCADLR